MRQYGLRLLVVLLFFGVLSAGCEFETKGREITEEDCDGQGNIMDVGSIPECIEHGMFDENSLGRVRVSGVSPEQSFRSDFRIKGFDSQDRFSVAYITVDHAGTYRTLTELSQQSGVRWVNLYCNYDSFNYVEDYEEGSKSLYAVIYLTDCIDLK